MKKGFAPIKHRDMARHLRQAIYLYHHDVANAYGKTSKAARLALKLDKAIEDLRCELDNLATQEGVLEDYYYGGSK
jgi:hypothetical protein